MTKKQQRIFSTAGAVLLFAAWLTQQFLYDRWNSRLNDLQRAENLFATYQSNNAIFNVLMFTTPKEKVSGSMGLRGFQMRNYETGLRWLEDTLSPSDRQGVELLTEKRMKENPYTGPGVDGEMTALQARLEVLDDLESNERASIAHKKTIAGRVFSAMYIIGSLLALAAAILSSDDKCLVEAAGDKHA